VQKINPSLVKSAKKNMQKFEIKSQEQFVERIKQVSQPNVSLVNELAELLEISPDSAYRRIRCEKSFAYEEIIRICDYYKISFDAFCSGNSEMVNFNYAAISNNKNSFINYYKGMCDELKNIATSKEKEIIYIAEDIPLFHLFNYPDLASFKIFYWLKSVINIPEYEQLKYNEKVVDPKIFDLGNEMIELYKTIPSIEIWSDRTIISMIKQIEYYYEIGLFKSREEAIHLCNVLSDAMHDIQTQAERTSKMTVAGYENTYRMYNSDIETGNNCIIVKAGGIRAVHLRFHTFNSMVTYDNHFFNMTEKWVSGLIKKSNLISGVAEKQRLQFFQKIQKNIMQLKERI